MTQGNGLHSDLNPSIGISDEIEVNGQGGKQTKIYEAITELPPHALLEVSRVMALGAQRYGSKNWHLIPVKSELDHSMRHCLNFLAGIDNPLEELAHFATRALMALDQYIRDENKRAEYNRAVASCTSEILEQKDGWDKAPVMPTGYVGNSVGLLQYSVPGLGQQAKAVN